MQNVTEARTIITDSDVYGDGDGWFRVVTFVIEDMVLGKAEVHVGRWPRDSYLRVSVWTANGWICLIDEPPVHWWKQMPGYERRDSDKTDSKSAQILERMIEQMALTAKYAELVL